MPLVAPALIESAHLFVRLATESDLPALMKVNGDSEVTKFLPYATWNSISDGQSWYQRMLDLQASGAALQFVIAEKYTGNAIGTCLMFRFEEASARAELGYVLGRAHWGRGLMREALAAVVDSAFNHMSLRRLEAEVSPSNEPSAHLLTRLGFTKEGLLRQRWVSKGEARDVAVFGLLSHEWSGLPSKKAASSPIETTRGR